MPEKEPKILAFCCNWCAYAGADLAGVSRLKYPENVRIIRVMCTGRVSEGLIMRAFESGFEGVLVAGCHLGECHYINGNEKAIRRVEKLQRLLELLGLGDGRLRFEEISASEGGKFAEVVRRFVDDLKGIPPVTCVFCGEAAETDVKAEIEK
ncbi:MAG TPA: hydrogenase iron-sulfur subunit, partial [Methanomicrobia archaeon]|nr:hydrogenase iron-sulfur subunit [Methanomicrobia archaeon]HEX58667.1 hydrogenase iron-sulfur subunit [Methanomicrobia archaeon]